MDILWIYFRYILDILWIYFGYILDILWIYFGYTLDILWIYFKFTDFKKFSNFGSFYICKGIFFPILVPTFFFLFFSLGREVNLPALICPFCFFIFLFFLFRFLVSFKTGFRIYFFFFRTGFKACYSSFVFSILYTFTFIFSSVYSSFVKRKIYFTNSLLFNLIENFSSYFPFSKYFLIISIILSITLSGSIFKFFRFNFFFSLYKFQYTVNTYPFKIILRKTGGRLYERYYRNPYVYDNTLS